MNLENYMHLFRNCIAGVNTKVPLSDGRMVTAINFDNAATTPPFIPVLKQVIDFAPWYSSVHRGTGYKSCLSSDIFEKSRYDILDFVHADKDKYTVIFVKNTTEALNKLSYRLQERGNNCVVLSTSMEHHSNDLPWREKYKVDYVPVDDYGRLCLDSLEQMLIKYKGRVKIVTVTGASNVTGIMNRIYEIASIAHKYNAMICVDGAQLIPHVPIHMNLDESRRIDFLAFSAHKMYAPFGIGVLIGPKEIFEKGAPEYAGGGTVKIVTPETVKWEDAPYKDEAGSPNLLGIIALTSSISILKKIGMENIEKYERKLTEYALKKLGCIKDIRIYGDKDCTKKLGIIAFNMDGIHHSILAKMLSEEAGISVRNGCFCAQPYVQKLLNIKPKELELYVNYPDIIRPGMVRISFGLYNNIKEIDMLAEMLDIISKDKMYYIKKYQTTCYQ